MSIKGAFIVVEDDPDDKDFFEEAVRHLGYKNEIIWFERTAPAFSFMKGNDMDIFMIFSDINIPGESGLELKFRITMITS